MKINIYSHEEASTQRQKIVKDILDLCYMHSRSELRYAKKMRVLERKLREIERIMGEKE